MLHSRYADHRYIELLRKRARILTKTRTTFRQRHGACAHGRSAERAPAILARYRKQPWSCAGDSLTGPARSYLDIVDYQMYVVDKEELTLPHPRVMERDFVVKPLLELLPGHVLADGTEVVLGDVLYGEAHAI